jgi:hypothetical protein
MAATVIRDNAKATWLTGLAVVRAKAGDIIQRAMAYAAATILICAVAAALVQLADVAEFGAQRARQFELPAPMNGDAPDRPGPGSKPVDQMG